jgi:cellulose synthase/poly-beta-1,6-N-acetylglucosamine synthase-like glycosyltransferase
MQNLSVLLIVAGCLLGLPVAILCCEVAAGLLTPRWRPAQLASSRTRPRLAVIVPAHDEERHLAATLRSVRCQLRIGDRLIVVADNCTDRTAAVAVAGGAEVVVRDDPAAPGKGHALDAGIRYLEDTPPEVVVFVDADCRLGHGSLDALAGTTQVTGRPAQGCYLILAAPGAVRDLPVAEFAQVVKNRVRPRGLHALGLPCQLAGSGMAFPWQLISSAELASSELVEDLKLGLACAMAGHAPVYCPDATIVSTFPASRQGAAVQRGRWQQGHLRLIGTAVIPLLTGLIRRDLRLVALVLDLMVPPLTLLLLANLMLAACAVVQLSSDGSALPLAIGILNLIGLSGAILTAWMTENGTLSPGRPSAILSYLAANLALYPRLLSRKPRRWVRTERSEVS